MAQGRLELAKILAQIILSDKKISFDDSVHYIPNKKLTEQALAHREPSSSVRKASPPDSLLTDCTPAVLEKAQTEQRNTACCHETAIGHRCSSTRCAATRCHGEHSKQRACETDPLRS
eukprot:19669-Heterococcus_DN1.PRE.1